MDIMEKRCNVSLDEYRLIAMSVRAGMQGKHLRFCWCMDR